MTPSTRTLWGSIIKKIKGSTSTGVRGQRALDFPPGYIKTLRNEQSQTVNIDRGVNFHNAVKRYLDINLKAKQ